jgi:hypothetical protein
LSKLINQAGKKVTVSKGQKEQKAKDSNATQHDKLDYIIELLEKGG